MILYGVPGVGKTSLAAQIPGVAFLIDQNEDGINRLKESNIVPADIPVLPPATSWADTLGMLDQLRTGEHNFKALALDALGGFERFCHEEVCRRDFGGEWGNRGFVNYQQGYEVALSDIRLFVNALDRLRDERGMSIVLLGHAKVSPFKNPSGPDYDRYNIDIHQKTWQLLLRWADMVLFANFEVAFAKGDESARKAKARGGQTRILYTEHHAAFDAKNRDNLPPEIEMGASGQEAWANLVEAIKIGRNGKAGE